MSVADVPRDIAEAGTGMVRLIRYDPRWVEAFDASAGGFLRSFAGPLISLPFVILIAGSICAFGALFSMFAWNWPVWLLLVVWLPAVLIITLGLMRPAKGLMVAAQVAQKASEAGRDHV